MSLNVPEFAVDTVAVGGVTVVSVAGEVDLLTGPLLRQALASLEPPLVIDLCGCAFLDSTGIKVIFECFSRRPGVRIACLPESAPARVLGLALRDRIPTHATLEEALAAAGAVADASDGSPG